MSCDHTRISSSSFSTCLGCKRTAQDIVNEQRERIEELEAGIRKSVRLFDENPYYTPEIMLELDALLPESGE